MGSEDLPRDIVCPVKACVDHSLVGLLMLTPSSTLPRYQAWLDACSTYISDSVCPLGWVCQCRMFMMCSEGDFESGGSDFISLFQNVPDNCRAQ